MLDKMDAMGVEYLQMPKEDIHLLLDERLFKQVNAWRLKNADKKGNPPSRTTALHSLVRAGLKAENSKK